MLKQGQVEVDPTNFIQDYKDSALIHRTVVEELNSNIKVGHMCVMGVKAGACMGAYLGQDPKVEQLGQAPWMLQYFLKILNLCLYTVKLLYLEL